jgi:hypothetical protein
LLGLSGKKIEAIFRRSYGYEAPEGERGFPQSSSSSSSFSTSLDAGNAPIANNLQKIENEDDDEDDWRGAYTALYTYLHFVSYVMK